MVLALYIDVLTLILFSVIIKKILKED